MAWGKLIAASCDKSLQPGQGMTSVAVVRLLTNDAEASDASTAHG